MDAPAVQSKRPVARREPREKPIVQDGSFYKAGNKKVPDARRVQKDTNKRNISIEILQTEQTEEYAEVIVRAWLPGNSQYTDGVVHHQFNVIRKLKALEYLEKQVSGKDIFFRGSPILMFEDLSQPFNKNGDPILTGVGYLKLLTEMARFENFAIRDATTKASRIAQLKLLNREWRDKDEVQSEKDEEKMVQESINDEKASKPQRTAKPAPTTKRTITKKTARRTRTPPKPKEPEWDETMPKSEKVQPKEPDNVQEGEVSPELNTDHIFASCPKGLQVAEAVRNDKKPLTKKNINNKAVAMMPEYLDADDIKEINKCIAEAEEAE